MADLSRLCEIMGRLRDPTNGCPWDLEQTFSSIVPHTIEEAYEVAEAIESGDMEHLPQELGDLLFQVIFYCRLGQERSYFSLEDVIASIEDKLVRRHPHVFGEGSAEDAAAVQQNWESIKADERRRHATARSGSKAQASELDGIARNLPALALAAKVQKRAARVGFDWRNAEGPMTKLREELAELEAARRGADKTEVAEELGDLLFSAVNLARHDGIDPEQCLRAATNKFEARFRLMERGEGSLAQLDAAGLNAAWNRAKSDLKKNADA